MLTGPTLSDVHLKMLQKSSRGLIQTTPTCSVAIQLMESSACLKETLFICNPPTNWLMICEALYSPSILKIRLKMVEDTSENKYCLG